MKPEENGTQAPSLLISLQLDNALDRIASPGSSLNRAVDLAIRQAVDGFMETLGIPGASVLAIEALEDPLPDGRFIRIVVEDRVLRYPDEAMKQVYCWSLGSVFRVDISLNEIRAWLIDRSQLEEAAPTVAGFLSRMTIEILKAQPSLLLGTRLFEDYRASMPTPAVGPANPWPPNAAWLHPILLQVLSLGISIADKQAIADSLAGNLSLPWLDACEHVIETLRPGTIKIHIRRDYLRELTTKDPDSRMGLLAFLREGLFQELGVEYPPFQLVLDPDLGPRQFRFTINHLSSMPLIGLGPDECLVNDSPDRLKTEEISLQPAGNPATALPNSLTQLENNAVLESHGYTTWDPMAYLVLSLAAHLRTNGHCLIHRDGTKSFLELAAAGYPELVKAVKSAFSVERITPVLRNLAMEELSIRNSKVILEALLDFHLYEISAAARSAQDGGDEGVHQNAPHIRKMTEFVRSAAKREVCAKISRETNTMVVYLLDKSFDELLTAPVLSAEPWECQPYTATGQEDRILEAIRTEIATLPSTALVPAILTVAHLRWPLRRTIAKELPRVHVVAFDELTPNLNVQPIARIY